jgi:sRNA-binding carbon storage regulator CsrA
MKTLEQRVKEGGVDIMISEQFIKVRVFRLTFNDMRIGFSQPKQISQKAVHPCRRRH